MRRLPSIFFISFVLILFTGLLSFAQNVEEKSQNETVSTEKTLNTTTQAAAPAVTQAATPSEGGSAPAKEQPTPEKEKPAPAATQAAAPAAGEEAVSKDLAAGATEQPSPKKVTAIEVKGNKNINTNTVISKIKTKIGGEYQETVASDDLKRLYLLGYFSDIKVDTEEYKNGLKVIITVTERPIIEKIGFSGIMHLTMREEKIKETLKSKETQYLDYPNLDEDVKAIKKLYEKIGYSQAVITYKVDIAKDTGKARIEFDIIESKRVIIRNIFIEGNKSFSSARILKLLKTKRAWFFNAGALKEEVLKEDIERVKSFYHKQGFTDVTVEYDVKPNAKKQFSLNVTIRIKEGKKYLVGTVTIQGNTHISNNDILGKLKECVPGKVFSEEALSQDVSNIQSLYFDKGYISAQAQEATSLNSYTGRIDIVYSVNEGDIAYLDKIKVRGNVKTKDIVIRRELRIRPGDKFDGEKLKRSKERLQNLGFFEDVKYDTEDTQVPDKKDLVVDVKESKTGSFSFGGGYSTVDEFVGFVEVEQKNFDWRNFPYFTGGGQNLKLRGSLGSISNGFDLSFTNPWVFDYPISFGFDAYKNTHQKQEDVGYGYDQDVIGGDLRLGKELTEYLRGDLTYRNDTIKISDIDDNASNDLKNEAGSNTISSLNFALTFDNRDSVFNPVRGNLLTGSIEGAGGPLQGTKDYWKAFGRASHYFPMFRGSALEIRGRVGVAQPYGDSDHVPIYERFFAGGSNTIRGYHERKVGPVDHDTQDPLGGEALLVGNIEYLYPLFSFLKVAAFYDVGNVWQKISDIGSTEDANGVSNSGGFKSGMGLGVRVKTPVGPIMLDYGIPLNKESGNDRVGSGKFHFSMSHGF